MTPPSNFDAMPATQAAASGFGANPQYSRGQVSFWLWAVAAPLGALLIATHNWLTI